MAQFSRAQRHRPDAVRSKEFRRREAERIRLQAIRDNELFWYRMR